MVKNLVIVESPAKAKTIEGFLGKEFTVKSSYGHVRDLNKSNLSLDMEHGFMPEYEVPDDKKHLVAELKKLSAGAEMVWLASDEDREGESISWHLYETLGLSEDKYRRIVFHEITKPAILHAIDNPRKIDMDLVAAQQARRVLDRLVGYELSPLLWKKVKPALSAGRVQSVAVRLIVEREDEIKNFVNSSAYRVTANFSFTIDNHEYQLFAELPTRFEKEEEAYKFLEDCKSAGYTIKAVEKKPVSKCPAPPFTTSTLQQEAGRKLGFSVSNTMRIAQQLYESGKITYMRTDSVNLSTFALGQAKKEIENLDAQIEKTVVNIDVSNSDKDFVASGEVVLFDGFLKVYIESVDDENGENVNSMLPPMRVGQVLDLDKMEAQQRFARKPFRYTEASLVKKMEELGIGRPSTYAPTISTIQKREYVEKKDIAGETRTFKIYTLKKNKITEKTGKENIGYEKAKLVPTDIGILVNKFLISYFETIVDYNFTANVEKEFDKIAEGRCEWNKMIKDFYKDFHKTITETSDNSGKFSGEKLLGVDPVSGKNVYVKIGRFGPVAQIGDTESDEKPKFAGLHKDQSIETITLDEVLDLFAFPRSLGEYEDAEIQVAIGRFGPYLKHKNAFYSLSKLDDPSLVTFQRAVEIIESKRKSDADNVVTTYPEDKDMLVLRGRFGIYISYKKTNYKIPRHYDANNLTYQDCLDIVNNPDNASKKRGKK